MPVNSTKMLRARLVAAERLREAAEQAALLGFTIGKDLPTKTQKGEHVPLIPKTK